MYSLFLRIQRRAFRRIQLSAIRIRNKSRFFHYLKISPSNWLHYFQLANKTKMPLPVHFQHRKVACILDEFSFECFRPEAQFQQLSLENWKAELENFRPDILFVESAWRGAQGSWSKKISQLSNEAIELLSWARNHGIPTVFWHKEVPPHFGTFMHVSKMFDYVFLTDADCIPKYQECLGHDRVYFMPFACQPKIHNPIETEKRRSAILYAGSFYPEYKYPERYHNFMDLYEALSPLAPIDIYDRNAGKDIYPFPEKFQQSIKGSLPFAQMSKTYRNYEYGLNMSSVKDSNTMCARRVFELIASNTFVVGNESKAIRNFFGELTLCSDSKDVIAKKFKHLQSNPIFREKTKLIALRKVMNEHTYKVRFQGMLEILRKEEVMENHQVTVIGMYSSEGDKAKLQSNFDRQKHLFKKLVFCKKGEPLPILQSEGGSLSIFDSNHYYGEYYLTDLLSAFVYSDADVATKSAYFKNTESGVKLMNEGNQYKMVDEFYPSRSLMKNSSSAPTGVTWDQAMKSKVASIDAYNFCDLSEKDVMTTQDLEAVSDLRGIDAGLSLHTLHGS